MVAPVLRGLASVITVLVAILGTSLWGDTAGRLTAAVLGAILIVAIEWFVQWSPRHLQWARALLDPRAIWTGVWVQDVEIVTDSTGRHPDDPNVCSVFRIDYKDEHYWVQGNAFGPDGVEVAHYESDGYPTFTKDGTTMSYVWKGDSSGPDTEVSAEKTGLATMTLDEGERNTGRGRVQHVGMNRELVFAVERVTSDFLDRLELRDTTPASLESRNARLAFGAKVARLFGAEGRATHASRPERQ